MVLSWTFLKSLFLASYMHTQSYHVVPYSSVQRGVTEFSFHLWQIVQPEVWQPMFTLSIGCWSLESLTREHSAEVSNGIFWRSIEPGHGPLWREKIKILVMKSIAKIMDPYSWSIRGESKLFPPHPTPYEFLGIRNSDIVRLGNPLLFHIAFRLTKSNFRFGILTWHRIRTI